MKGIIERYQIDMENFKPGKNYENSLSSLGKELESGFSKRLRQAIGDQSVLSFAQKCGFSDSLVRKYLSGSLPGLDKLVVLAEVAGVRAGWLAVGEPPMLSDVKGSERRGKGGRKFTDAEAELVDLWNQYRQGLGAGEPATTAMQGFVEEYNKSGLVGHVPGVDRLTVEELDKLRRRVRAAEGGSYPETPQDADFSKEFALIPRYDVRVSAGPGSHVEDEKEVHRMAFRREWLRREGLQPDRLVLVSASGDSMSPTVAEGDLLLVDTGRRSVQDDSIYVLRVEDEVIAKRLQRDWEGGLWVRSDSDHYSDQHISDQAAARLDVVGRVAWIGKRI